VLSNWTPISITNISFRVFISPLQSIIDSNNSRQHIFISFDSIAIAELVMDLKKSSVSQDAKKKSPVNVNIVLYVSYTYLF
jgi:hypothetical protein